MQKSVCLLFCGAVTASFAQVDGEQSRYDRPQPAALIVSTPSSTFPSSLTQYRRLDPETPLVDWRKANDTVRQIGGWRAYAREAAAAQAPVRTNPPAAEKRNTP